MIYLAYNPDSNGNEPVGTSTRTLRKDLKTDAGARRWMRGLVFYREGVTELYRMRETDIYRYAFKGDRID